MLPSNWLKRLALHLASRNKVRGRKTPGEKSGPARGKTPAAATNLVHPPRACATPQPRHRTLVNSWLTVFANPRATRHSRSGLSPTRATPSAKPATRASKSRRSPWPRVPPRSAPAQRAEYRGIIASEGLTFVGLHWLMVSPAGLHVTTPDPGSAPAELGARSPPDRSVRRPWAAARRHGLRLAQPARAPPAALTPRRSHAQFRRRACRAIAPHAAERGVTVLVEALPTGQCDVVRRWTRRPRDRAPDRPVPRSAPCSTCTTPSMKPSRTPCWWTAIST